MQPGYSARRLAACAFFVFAPIGVQMPFFPLWLSASGFKSDGIALVLGITPVVRFASNLLIPPRADRSGDAASLLFACAAGTAVVQAMTGLALGYAWIFALTLLAASMQGPMASLLDSTVLREVRRRVLAKEPKLEYGAIRGVGSLSVLVLMLGGGVLVGATPPAAVIWLIAGVSGIAAIAVRLLLPPRKRDSGSPADRQPRGRIERPAAVALIILASSAAQSSHAMVYAFGSIGWRANGYSDGSIGLLWASGVATEVALFMFANRFFRGRLRPSALLAGGTAIALLRWCVMAASPSPLVLVGAQLLHAGSFAATYLGAVLGLAALAGEQRRAQVQGWMSAANAISIAAVTIASGPLWTRFGMHSYLAMAALAGLGLLAAAASAIYGNRQPQSDGSGG